MQKQILLAVDGSKKGFEAVSIMGDSLKGQPGVGLVLFHCVHQLGADSPEDLCTDYFESCKLPIGDQEKVGHEVLDEALKQLKTVGFPQDRVEVRLKINSMDPAKDIIAEAELRKFDTIALGRRGRSALQNLLLGSVSGKVAQYASKHTVWVVDTPVHQTNKVLIAMEGAPDCLELVHYAGDVIGSNGDMEFTFLHIMPPVPPTFWDDGHILGSDEQKDRRSRMDKWRADWTAKVEKFMAEGRQYLVSKGVSADKVQTVILPTKQGVARDLLNEIDEHKFKMVLLGKKSLNERKPFLMGSHASKILQNAKGSILCLVDF